MVVVVTAVVVIVVIVVIVVGVGCIYIFKWAKNTLHHKRVSLRWHCFGKACVNAGHFYWHAIHRINRCSLDFTTHLNSHKYTHKHNFSRTICTHRTCLVSLWEESELEKKKKTRTSDKFHANHKFCSSCRRVYAFAWTDADAAHAAFFLLLSCLLSRQYFISREPAHIFEINLSVSVTHVAWFRYPLSRCEPLKCLYFWICPRLNRSIVAGSQVSACANFHQVSTFFSIILARFSFTLTAAYSCVCVCSSEQ